MARAGTRLDQWLVAQGYVDTRSRARWLIESGQVRVDGRPSRKGATVISAQSQVDIHGEGLPYVSRGGLKLAHALQAFRVDVADLVALDVGASTGGFTDCLLRHGAKRVYALDVGAGQLHRSLRDDARVIPLEGRNLRTFQAAALPEPVDLITVDVSFISLSLVLPLLPSFLRPGGCVIALLKPQFEVGLHGVGRGGIVRDAALRELAVRRVVEAASAAGFRVLHTTAAPRSQARGNQEVLLCLGFTAEPRSPEGMA